MIRYQDAAKRHWDDAKYLESNDALPNSDYHRCLAVECMLKWFMVRSGKYAVSSDGNLNCPGSDKHIHVFFNTFSCELYRIRSKHTRGMEGICRGPNPFAGWTINERYYENCFFKEEDWLDKYQTRKSVSEKVMKIFENARLDGIV